MCVGIFSGDARSSPRSAQAIVARMGVHPRYYSELPTSAEHRRATERQDPKKFIYSGNKGIIEYEFR